MTASGGVCVFGGTFDPVHLGHLASADDAADALGAEQVLFVLNRAPPHKVGWQVSDAIDRLAMLRLAAAGNSRFDVSTVEIDRDGPSYTLDTMRELRARLGAETRLVFLLGFDALAELHTWHQPQRLLDEFEIVLLDRPTNDDPRWDIAGHHFPGIRNRIRAVHVVQLAISSRDIRERVRAGRPYRYLVPEPVAQYIATRGLYTAG
jgi:nicotinate-nucleotide adenylyltransferase